MVGASLAAMLASANPQWKITLLEAHPLPEASGAKGYQPSFDARASALAYGSTTLLDDLGLWSHLVQHATPITRVHISDRGHLGGSQVDAAEQGLPALGYVVENAWLGQVLMAHLQAQPQVDMRAPVAVRALTPRRGGYRLQLESREGDESLDCQLAIVVDGADSPLRAALGIEADVRDYAQTAMIANIGLSRPHGGIAYERFTPEGPLALLPLGDSPSGRRAALVWTQPGRCVDALLAESEADCLSRLQNAFGWRLGRFEKLGERHAYPLHLVQAREQVRSHLVIAGNAAHLLHPVAGQGFNLALRDCACLTEVLCEGVRAGEPLGQLRRLQDYTRRQAQDQALTTAFSDQLVRLFSTESLPHAALRHLGLLGLDWVPVAHRSFAARAMGRGGRRSRWHSPSEQGVRQ